MLGDISITEHIYIAVGYTHKRKQIDGLSALVTAKFRLAPFSNSLFLFCGRNTRVMKALHWEGDALCFFTRDWKKADLNGLEMNPKQKK